MFNGYAVSFCFTASGIRVRWEARRLRPFFRIWSSMERWRQLRRAQALAALFFFYREVLGVELLWLDKITRAKKLVRLPTVLTRTEVQSVLVRMDGTYALMARLLCGTGMRLMKCCRLRV